MTQIQQCKSDAGPSAHLTGSLASVDSCLDIRFAGLTPLWGCLESCYLGGFTANYKGINLVSALICVVGLHITEGLGTQEI